MRLTTRQKMALARFCQSPVLSIRRALGRGHVANVKRRGLHWRLDLREAIDFAIWLQGYFEPATVAAYRAVLRPGSVVIDIGANVGAHTLPLAQAVGPRGYVVACEPTAEAFSRLRTNVAANPTLATHIRPRQAMLLAEPTSPLPRSVMASWPLAPTGDVHPTIRGRYLSTSRATVTTLDDLVAEEALERVDMLKLDVDGYECDVLDGATQTLARFRPTVITEIDPFALEAAGRQLEELLTRFKVAGYRLHPMNGGPPLSEESLYLLCKRGVSMNALARPTTE
jgi:FkbM family methyltransferase